jgi:hypothetical protein
MSTQKLANRPDPPDPLGLPAALVPVGAFVLLLGLSFFLFGDAAAAGPNQALMFCSILAIAVAWWHGHSIGEMRDAAVASVTAGLPVRRAEVTIRHDRYGRLQLGQGSSAADDTAEYDLSLVAGPIMYAGAGGIGFTDGTGYSNVAVGDAFFDFDGDRMARIRYDSLMLGPVQGSASYGQDDQWAAANTLGGDYGDWSGWTLGDFTLLAAASAYDPDDDTVDYGYAASGSVLHDPTGLSLTLSIGSYELKEGNDPSNLYAKIGWDTRFWPLGPDRIRYRLHPWREHQRQPRRRQLVRPRRSAEDRPLWDRPLQPAPVVRTRPRHRGWPQGHRCRHVRD